MQTRVKILVLTKGEWTTGFHLAGIDVREVHDAQEARSVIIPYIESQEPCLIAIEEDLYPHHDKKILKHLEENPFPVLIPMPDITAHNKEGQEKYVSELVRSCIGYYVKIK